MNRAGSALVPEPLRARLAALMDEGSEIWGRFDREVRGHTWHPFVPSDYERVLETLAGMQPARFLEWGSATGVITIMADLLGFEAYGIEQDGDLVTVARALAGRYQSRAQFALGSFLPTGYQWKPKSGDARKGTLGDGASAYGSLGHSLEDFDVVYAYPWSGEEALMLDLIQSYGGKRARLLLHGDDGVRIYSAGRLENPGSAS